MSLMIIFGILSFVGFFLIALFMLPRSSAQSVLLDEVTRQAREVRTTGAPAARAGVDIDWLAKPFTSFRRLFSSEPDPDLVRRLLLAGYRKPAHVDIFLGARLVLPVVLGCVVAILASTNLFFFIITLVVAFFIPDFWLNFAVKKRRERIRLSLPDGLDLLAICIEAGLGLDQGIVRVGQELRVSHPQLSEELLQINLEQRAGATRIAAWQSFAALRSHAGADRPIRNPDRQIVGGFLRHIADSAPAKGRRNGRQDDHQTDTAAGIFYFPKYRGCDSRSRSHLDLGKP